MTASKTSITVKVFPGAIIRVGTETYCVRRLATLDSVWARNIQTGLDREIALHLISETSAGPDSSQPDLIEIDEQQWAEALSRHRAVVEATSGIGARRKAVEQVARSNGVSTATLYRWISDFRQAGSVLALLRKRRSDRKKSRTSEQVNALIDAVIADEYLTGQKKSPAEAFTELRRRCYKADIVPVSFPTFLKRIDRVAPAERAQKRDQRHLASRLNQVVGAMQDICTPMAMVQIDHTLVDIELVDEVHRIAIGRPWITLAIDVDSRMVVAWYASLDPPGALATGICIANAILPKTPLLAEWGLEYEWPCQGIPAVIHVDNAREFRGNTLAMACQKYNFNLQFRHLKKPEHGAHIERLCGTLMTRIHALPGTTYSNPKDREDYPSEEKSIFTLDEFNKWLAHCILGRYHNDMHRSLGCAPLKRFRDGILGDDERPGIGVLTLPLDANRVKLDFLPYELRTVQASGIELNNVLYQSDVLRRWVGAKDPKSRRSKRKFICRYDPRDISSILFFDPEIEDYFRIPYRNSQHPAISLWELRSIKEKIRIEGKESINEEAIFFALDEMRQIESAAKEATRKQRRQSQRRKQHAKTIAPYGRVLNASASDAARDDDHFDDALQPFDGITGGE